MLKAKYSNLIQIAICTIPPRITEIDGAKGKVASQRKKNQEEEARREKTNRKIRKASKEHQFLLLDLSKKIPKEQRNFYCDGLHFSNQGNLFYRQLILNLIANATRKLK